MYVETEGFEVVISWYLAVLVGLAVLTIVSPLIFISVPLVALLGPPAIAWWRGRGRLPRVGTVMRVWLIVSSSLVFLTPVIPGIWFILSIDTGAPKESFWLLMTGIALLPFPASAVAYARRVALSARRSGRLPVST